MHNVFTESLITMHTVHITKSPNKEVDVVIRRNVSRPTERQNI